MSTGHFVRSRIAHSLRIGAIVIGTAVVAFPIYWMIVTAIQPLTISLSFPPPLVPTDFDFSGFVSAITELPLIQWLSNSTVLAGVATLITTSLAILGAYCLSVLRWKGKLLLGFGLLLTQLMPEAVIVVPVFDIFRRTGMVQNLVAVSLLHAAFILPIAIWILKSSFDRIPREIVEAGLIDGCGHLGVLRRMIIPVSVPAIVAVSVVAFFTSWSEYLFTTTLISRAELYPASLGLASMISQLDTPVAELLSAGLIYALLPVVLYTIAQKYIIAGMTAGAVKG
ncbi:carbohydrate ABC transporter permease [Paramicrobacterium chengjingii]|uniref:carbohydrate ABC transporter permease n=1 Tax=Paramicrobacterium chengjingii TaxID=2769067 RepID=UPI0014206C43|nr:carbohydrate ABC transporter permease [Microbacterium chengjingii]